jgi:hypothetical protein
MHVVSSSRATGPVDRDLISSRRSPLGSRGASSESLATGGGLTRARGTSNRSHPNKAQDR